MRIGSLFSGCFGMELGLEQSGLGETVWYSEIDKYASAVCRYHKPEIRNYGDATRIKPSELPDVDIIAFGWPCQDNSIAGKRKGLAGGSRSSLIIEAMRIIRIKKPKYFIAENVKGLFSVNDGNDFYTAIGMFANAGYDCQWQMVNTRWFLPQNRERIIFVGHIRGERRPEVFPVEHMPLNAKSFVARLDAQRHKKRIRNDNNHQREHESTVQLYNNTRYLTPVECERLQGFPDNWTKWGIFGNDIREISDTQRYKMIGNAVSVPVVRMIGERLTTLKELELCSK